MSLKNLSARNKVHKFIKAKLSINRINTIYNKFEKSCDIDEKFLVAVSGGPDSLALAFLAKVFSVKKNIPSKFVIIDHRLRKESRTEANKVKMILKKNFINAEIIAWRGPKPLKNIQSLARKERYKLLLKKCKDLNINNILVGHHQDDLIENFFIRMIRGSGLKGLVSLSEKSNIEGKILIRPLLDQKKEDLVFISKNIFNFYVKDPSNENENFQRIMVRNLLNQLKKNGLDDKKILKMIKNLKKSDFVINFYVLQNLKNNTFSSKKSDKIILNSKFFIQPYEVILRSLSELIRIVGQRYYTVRGKKLDLIIDKIAKSSSFQATLGGCIIKKVSQTVILRKEH